MASRNVRVLVVGNPANTNAYIAMKSAPICRPRTSPPCCAWTTTALPRRSPPRWHGRGRHRKLAVWGNHSPTMYADYRFATVNGKSVKDTINDHDWNANVFLPTVGKRGAAIIAARGLSSAASAANAAIDHMRDWALGTNGKWVTMGIPSNGEYGIPKETMFGYPSPANAASTRSSKACHRRLQPRVHQQDPGRTRRREQDGVKHLL